MTKEMEKGLQRYAHTQCEREKERMKERKAEKRPCRLQFMKSIALQKLILSYCSVRILNLLN